MNRRAEACEPALIAVLQMAKGAEEPEPQSTDDEDEGDESTLLKFFTPGSDFDEVCGMLSFRCVAQFSRDIELAAVSNAAEQLR